MMDAKLLLIGKIEPNPEWEMALHRHDHHELIVIISGRLHVWDYEKNHMQGTAGDIFLYPSGAFHEEKSDTEQPVETIYFVFSGAFLFSGITMLRDRDRRIKTLSQWIINAKIESTRQMQRIQDRYFQAIIGEIQDLTTGRTELDIVRKLRRFMLANISKRISLNDLAKYAGMSKYHFAREYKRISNGTPMADLKKMRLAEIKTHLLRSDRPLKSIASAVGFANEYHLAREFKAAFRITPGEFRKSEVKRKVFYTVTSKSGNR
jgi:AraC-like DNA-binding protein